MNHPRKNLRLILRSSVALLLPALALGFATANVEGNAKTHDKALARLTDAAISRYLLVKAGSDNNHIAVTDAAIPAVGVTDDEASAAEASIAIKLLGRGPTTKLTASEAMATIGVPVYQAAGGKIALTGAILVGTLQSTAAADGDVVEVDTCLPQVTGAVTLTGATTLVPSQSGMTFFLALAGGFTVTLPPNANAGFKATFIVKTAPTTAYIIAAATADTIIGYPQSSAGADETANGNAAGDQINFVANTALPSDRVDVTFDGTSIHASCRGKATGAITITG